MDIPIKPLYVAYMKGYEQNKHLIAFFKGTAGEYLKLKDLAYILPARSAAMREAQKPIYQNV